MFKLVLRKIRSNFTHYFLIFIGYFSALLVILFGFIFLKCSKDMTIDYTNGKIEHQRLISVNVNDSNNMDYNNLINVLKKHSKTTSIRIDGLIEEVPINEKIFEVPIQPVIFSETPEWIPQITNGRYLNPRESSSKAKIAVIGKGVELNKLSKNNYINLCGEKFKIIGIAGKKSNFSNYLGSVFIPLESLPDKMKNNIKTIQIYLLKNNNSPEKEMNKILNDLNKLSNIKATQVEIMDNLSEFYSTLSITVFVSCLIILVSVSNISILIFYLMLKNKKNILISIALGANRKMIWKQIFIELMLVSLCAIISALIVVHLLIPFVKDNFTHILNVENIQFSYFNIIATSLAPIIMSFLISIISVKKFFNLDLTMELKGE
ncbi:ABC transporter permease [Clostridium tetani]|uniref:Putative ABC transporter-associated permease n=2 Tax=Clostridium tetani TaxID=1513 RepID=Q899W1_CLOTE|nr:ABC transporter permease [Clostridium tetani]AAO37448.1 putative ABC transporter-associated permease [Clostridium tetani E88]KGI36634.1 ABC transporter permease [Clostridium tetani]KHO30760.1 ABC transporter permease [Clostridium tetani]KIG19883.1 ABC transporter permease [Clostridium tetani]RXI61533.1 ABC transporter permease [Clostridium tetani]